MNKKIIAGYCRTATTDDMAVKRQRAYFEEYVKEHSAAKIVYYVDNGCSGLDYNRPAFRRLNRDISSGKVNQVVVQNLSRIGRDTALTLKWIKDIHEQGASVVAPDIPAKLLEAIRVRSCGVKTTKIVR